MWVVVALAAAGGFAFGYVAARVRRSSRRRLSVWLSVEAGERSDTPPVP